jgi:hypothetical protein
MVRKILAWMLAAALFNFILFTVCFFWHEIHKVVATTEGLFFAFVIIAGLLVPLTIRKYTEHRKREEVRKHVKLNKVRHEVEAQVRKEVGIDF